MGNKKAKSGVQEFFGRAKMLYKAMQRSLSLVLALALIFSVMLTGIAVAGESQDLSTLLENNLKYHMTFDGNSTSTTGEATTENNVTYVTGKRGQAVSFTQGTSYVELDELTWNDKPANYNFSINMWVNDLNTTTTSVLFCNKKYTTNNFNGFVFVSKPTYCIFNIYDITNYSPAVRIDLQTTRGIPKDGNYHMVSATVDRSTNYITVYIDGVYSGKKDISALAGSPIQSTSNRTMIGCAGTGSWDGTPNIKVDDFMYFDDVLSQENITELYSLAGDTAAPVISTVAQPSEGGWVNEAYNIPAYTATDNGGMVISSSVKVTDPDGNPVTITEVTGNPQYIYSFTPDKIGQYKLTYTAMDVAGNTAEATYDIQVEASRTRRITLQDDGNGSAYASASAALPGTVITLTATANFGYKFKEWQVVSPAGLTITNNSFIMPDTDVVVNAIFEVKPIVTFNTGKLVWSTQIPPQYVDEGGVVVRPEDPTRDGYTFGGWYKEAACTNLWDFDVDRALSDTVLYAKWTLQSGPAEVTFGVTSDNHISDAYAYASRRIDKLAKTFQFFNSAGADAAFSCGDTTNAASETEYATWMSTVNANKGDDMIVMVAHGNHDADTGVLASQTYGQQLNVDRVINGYHFITIAPGTGPLDETTGLGATQGVSNYTYVQSWLKGRLDADVAEDSTKPIFVFLHFPLKGTFYGSDNGTSYLSKSFFEPYPQVVTFGGHIHKPSSLPTSIWQSGFTAVNVPSTAYITAGDGTVSGTPEAADLCEAILVSANGSQVTIKDYNVASDQYFPRTWTFDVSHPEAFRYTDARANTAVAPSFPSGAAVRVNSITDRTVTLNFDQASAESVNNTDDVVFSYTYDIIDSSTGQTVNTFKTFSKFYLTPMPSTVTHMVTGLLPGKQYEVRIHATDAYEKTSSDFISATFTTKDMSSLSFSELETSMPAPADLLDVDFSGGTVTDHSPANHTFTAGTAPIAMDSTLGKYVARYTGSSGQASLVPWSDDDYDKINDGFTFEAIFCATGTGPIFGNQASSGTLLTVSAGTQEGKGSLGISAFIGGSGVTQSAKADDVITYGQWYHAAAVYDGMGLRLYLNGTQVALEYAAGEVYTPETFAHTYVIGGDIANAGGYATPIFKGSLSLCRIYSEPLSALDIYRMSRKELLSLDTAKPVLRVNTTPNAYGVVDESYNVPAFAAVDDSGVIASSGSKMKGPDGLDVALTPASGGTFTFTPSVIGKYVLTCFAADSAGNEAELRFTIEVAEPDTQILNVTPTSGNVVTVTLNRARARTEAVIIAVYDNKGKLLSIGKNNTTVETAVPVTVPLTADAYRIKAFVWREISIMKSLCGVKIIKWDGSAWKKED